MEKMMALQCKPTTPSTQLYPNTTPAFVPTHLAPIYSCSLCCSNVISFRIPKRISLGFYTFRNILKRTRIVSLKNGSFWEDPDDGSDSGDDDEEDNEGDNEMEENDSDVEDYGAENEAKVNSTNGSCSNDHEEEFIKEVEQLLSPEEREILYRNQTPQLEKISTAKWNPLHTFALAWQIQFMDRHLEEGLDINVVDKDGLTALHHAVIGKKESVISHLLRKGANPQPRDLDGVAPLHYAVQVGAMQTVKLLIKYKVDVNVADNDGWTPLHVAMQSRNRDIAKILLVNGADKYRKNKDGNTPLDLSLCYGRDFKSYDLAKLLKLVPADREL